MLSLRTVNSQNMPVM